MDLTVADLNCIAELVLRFTTCSSFRTTDGVGKER
jgi:hypothetical protein